MTMAELIPGLPEEIALECLTRSHYTTHRVAARVCRRWRQLFLSPDFYKLRRKSGQTHKAVSLIQSLPAQAGPDGAKAASSAAAYGISVFDPAAGNWTRIEPIGKYPNGLPLFCRIISSEGKLVVIGGWEPATYRPVDDVFVYEFATERWRQGKGMPERRSFFGAAAHGGEIFVAGGHDEGKNAAATAWAYDVRKDEWRELPAMGAARDECEAVTIGSEIWVVSGYETENQGAFVNSAEVFETETGRWRRVGRAWKGERGPRGMVVADGDGGIYSWAEAATAAKEGVVGVDLGERAMVFGWEYLGGKYGMFVREGQNGKFEMIEVPPEFSGFVQSACSTEI